MRHAYKTDASTEAPPIAESNDPGFPTDGDGDQVLPTVIGTYWAHAVSSEIINCITAAGLTASGDDLGQLSESVTTRVATAIAALTIPTPFDFATRNEHIQAMPPGNEAANPADARFAINAYLAARV